jgi:hypothetical protein
MFIVASLSSNPLIKYSIWIGISSKRPVKTVVMEDVYGNILSSGPLIRYSIGTSQGATVRIMYSGMVTSLCFSQSIRHFRDLPKDGCKNNRHEGRL